MSHRAPTVSVHVLALAVGATFALPDIPLPPDMAKMTGVPTLVGLCVPHMGMHAILATEIERNRDPQRARALNPALHDFDAWLAANGAKIPIG